MMLNTIDRAYSAETLRRLQWTELEIFKEFVRICDKYELEYFGFAGTGIGAIRHHGFIPWDDDIDVGMPRRDYDRFLSVAKDEMSGEYDLMNAYENECYPLATTRMMKRGTEFRDYSFKDLPCKLGIFLDIFPYDNLAEDAKQRNRQIRMAWFWSKLCILRATGNPTLALRGWKRGVVHAACACAHGTMALLHISQRWLFSRLERWMRKYEATPANEIGYLCGTHLYTNLVQKEDLYPLVTLPFEDTEMQFPHNLDKMLRECYGDYIVPPPEDERCNHVPYRLEFGDDRQ